MRRFAGALSIAAGLIAAAAAPAAAAPADAEARGAAASVRLVRIGTFAEPVHVSAPPRDRSRVFVVQQPGTIRVVRNGRTLGRPFLDIRSLVRSGGERGLFAIAFAPDYHRTRRFYVHYTNRNGDTRVDEFRRSKRNPNVALRGSRRNVLAVAQPEDNHNGGQIAFGPDGLLYIGLGDGGGAGDRHGDIGNAQDFGTLLGKILRIDPRRAGGRAYRIPRGNPFVNRAGARPEIYSYGLRNPWRFSFDRSTGALTIGDVGQNAWEEIDYVARGRGAGANFGWRVFEGRSRYRPGEQAPGHVAPVLVKSHRAGYCSITGGVVVRDRNLRALRGRYLYSDICLGSIRSVRLTSRGARGDRSTGLSASTVVSFGEDARGRVYVASLDGPVYRLAAR